MLKKIVVIGPECTGKTVLCQQLAEHYGTIWCPEYAREYLLNHGKKYSYDDLLTIAKGQVYLEEKYVQLVNNSRYPTAVNQQSVNSHSPLTRHTEQSEGHYSLLFIDTDMYVMKIWCEYVFGKCHSFILDQLAKSKYDLYLLCNTDLPWVQDELREYPDFEIRQKLYRIYKNTMMSQTTPWVEISGNYEDRLQQGIIATDLLLKKTITKS